ncbi:hypothetical protein BOX15_Mlig009980g1 [Macrostomum lignano]|uniref:Uncharacterized protein n=1 Tax=Macrostomum lignano TaxID=282301 RepID=A0A267EUT0_9PLAT|nr:hypothetical protein BOX15_Mlig009980g1 [Macrostomum lignano]
MLFSGSASIHNQRPVLMQLGIPLIVKKLEHLISRFCMFNCSRETKSYIPVLSPAVLSNYLNGPLCARLRRGLPMSVEETAFQNAENVACVIEFITRSYTTASDAHNEVQLLTGTPLNLAADNVLELFSTEKAAFLTSWSERIFSDPNARKMFAHKLVLDVFLKNFELYNNAIESRLFKEFEIADFSELLAKFFPNLICSSRRLIPNINSTGDVLVSDDWLKNVWEFLSSKIHSESHELKKLSCLSNAALLPIESGSNDSSQSKLATVSLLPCVLCVDGRASLSNLNIDLLAALDELHCPKINSDNYFLRSHCGSVDRPAKMLRVFNCILMSKSPSSRQAFVVLQYIQENWQSLLSAYKVEQLCTIVKKLPIFVTLDGQCVSVSDKTVYVLSAKIATSDMHLWKLDQSTVLLKQENQLKNLFTCLSFSNLDQWGAYAAFILPVFSEFSNSTKFQHIDMLQKKVSQLLPEQKLRAEQKNVLALLKSTEIVFAHGRWRLASAFYDDSVELFKHIVPEDELLPSHYRQQSMRKLLNHAGLISECSEDLLLSFAKNLEEEGQRKFTADVTKKSEAIISYLKQQVPL